MNVAVSLRFWTSQAIGALKANGWNWQHTIQHGGSSTKLKDLNLFFFLESLSCWVGGWVTSNVSKLWALFWQACDLRHCRRANAWICERGATTEVWKNSLELQLKFCQHGRPVSSEEMHDATVMLATQVEICAEKCYRRWIRNVDRARRQHWTRQQVDGSNWDGQKECDLFVSWFFPISISMFEEVHVNEACKCENGWGNVEDMRHDSRAPSTWDIMRHHRTRQFFGQ